MNLHTALESQVGAAARRRGEEAFRAGRVVISGHGKSFVSAVVSDPHRHEVEIDRIADQLTVSCTCPSFRRDHQVCEHLWAAVLAADARGYLTSAAGRAPAALEAVDPDFWSQGPADIDAELQRDLAELLGGFPAPRKRPRRDLPAPRPGPPALPAPLAPPEGRPATPPAPPTLRPPEPAQRTPQPLPVPPSPRSLPPPPAWSRPPAARPGWREHLAQAAAVPAPAGRPIQDLRFVIDLRFTARTGSLVLEVQHRSRRAGGAWGQFSGLRLEREHITRRLPLAIDRQILGLLAGARPSLGEGPAWYGWRGAEMVPVRSELPEALLPLLLPLLGESGRTYLQDERQTAASPLSWDGGEPWRLCLEVRRADADAFTVAGSLRRGDEWMALDQPVILLRAGYLFTADRIARFAVGAAFEWIILLRRQRRLRVPAADAEALVEALVNHPTAPSIDLPDELRCEEAAEPPRPRLLLLDTAGGAEAWVPAVVSFRYGDGEVAAGAPGRSIYQRAGRKLWVRDPDAEARALERLREAGFRPLAGAGSRGGPAEQRRIPRRRLAAALHALVALGWLVEARGQRLRAPGRSHLAVSSRTDWFELHGSVEFDGEAVPVPQLLAAVRRGDDSIRLGDGSAGLLPEEWLRSIAPLAAFGEPAGDHLRFRPAQVGLLDALLAAEPAAACDELFAQARQRLRRLDGVAEAEAPAGFRGELRHYQKAGLGWLGFLRDLGFGGCLADDMGLGKTVQVLALLEARRGLRRRQGLGPSLAVVPRSLIFNWLEEAARFTPGLRVRNHTGADRDVRGEDFQESDLVLTTYGTLRRDVAALREREFDYVILDEAQTIKNPQSESAKAARLLKGSHRLVLTGTPIENHLGDLWSLLEFLNPGITGASSVLQSAGGSLRDPSEATRERLSRALAPFILRRTKEQVAAELPAKSEQTIYCTLPARQRRLYDELRLHYRASLGSRVQEKGLGRAKILVLEALLRLRQAACHPGLIDPARGEEPSAKLEFLVPQLAEVIEEGHKALVFSQFTSFLALLRRQLDAQGIAHAYLDGRTRDRAQRVRQFQEDPACGLFLISLKAGGLGLNLTAAEYVYLLDPWWNPAVEAQAIDRAHRIGQSRQVFAYRIVAKDTVEEKILALQQSKRQLADAIVKADDSLLRRLTRDDLELLLS